MPEKVETMNEQEKKWQAEADANTLAEAAQISADEDRLKTAQKAAKRMLKEREERAEAIKAVATGEIAYPDTSFDE